jgi:uncharacterized protein YbgA (DUF1722 family)
VAIGMGIPRNPIRLIQTDAGIRAVDSVNLVDDYTKPLQRYAESVVPQLQDVDGYVLMQGSPSCGMARVKRYNDKMIPEKNASGIYAEVIQRKLPALPVEESGRLTDPNLVENFVQRLYVYQAWRLEQPWRSAQTLIEFHARQKYLLMMHDYPTYKALGRLLSDLSDRSTLPAIGEDYLQQLMAALKKVPKRGQRVNVMQHVLGYFKQILSEKEKASLQRSIEQYQQQQVPFIVPIALLKHYTELHGEAFPYLIQQTFLNPYPEALGLRNPI